MTAAALPRPLPAIDKDSAAFWTGGKDGRLLIHRCGDCGYYVHPPVRSCPECESRAVAPQPVSGRGRIYTYTINYKQWVPGLPERYVLALVALEEQGDVLLPCNVVNCSPDDVTFDMPVKVLFERHEDVWVPLFEPAEG